MGQGQERRHFAPLGPWLVTPDEFGPSSRRPLAYGERRAQANGNTADLIFDVPTLVSYISQFMTLLPGDVISTGTPAGVGLVKLPPST